MLAHADDVALSLEPGALASLTSEAWYVYSSHGLTETRTSTDGDPTTIEAVRTLSYDADGRLITDETDEGDYGTIDTWKACVFAADGTSVCTFDSFADGVNAVSYVHEYDELGNITREERDLDVDGNVDGARTWAYTYDGEGQILTTQYDDNGDGVVGAADSLSTNVWDTDGHVVRTEFDRGLDGVADAVSTNEYDGLERLVRMTQDNDADGLLDFEYTLLWSVEGNLSQTGWMTSEGGAVATTTYDYDAEGRQVAYRKDHETDGTTDESGAASFPSDLVTESLYDYDADGNDDGWSRTTLACP